MSDSTKNLLNILKEEVGYSEKSDGYSKFGGWYAKHVDKDPAFEKAPWCDMAISWAADKAGIQDSVGQFASTVMHAKWFKEKDAWTTKPSPGAVVFFDYDGSKDLDAIDHVGLVDKVEDGKVHTVEANVDGGNVKEKVRDEDIIVGYGRPDKVQGQILAKSGKSGTDGTKALTSTSPASFTPPAGTAPAEPQQAVLSGLLVMLVAIVYVTGVLARLRLPAAANQLSGAVTAMTATVTATATAAMSAMTTARGGSPARDLASRVRDTFRTLPRWPRRGGLHRRR